MHSNKWFQKGFTLIELLVVVAIIGILAAIILSASQRARNEGADAGIKSNLSTVRSVAELYYLNNGNFYLPAGTGAVFGPATCPTSYDASGTNMFSQSRNIVDAVAQATALGSGVNYCANSSNDWAMAVGIKTDLTKSWCIDTNGAAKIENAIPSLSIDPTTFRCY